MNPNSPAGIISIILVLLFIWAILFLLFRQLVCWYWKINKAIGLLESIESHLSEMRSSKTVGESNKPQEDMRSKLERFKETERR